MFYFMKYLLIFCYFYHIIKVFSRYNINLTQVNSLATILKRTLCDKFIQTNKFVRVWQWKNKLFLLILFLHFLLFRWILAWNLRLNVQKSLLATFYFSLVIVHRNVIFYHSPWKKVNVRKDQTRFLNLSLNQSCLFKQTCSRINDCPVYSESKKLLQSFWFIDILKHKEIFYETHFNHKFFSQGHW